MPPNEIVLNNQIFQHIKTRLHSPVSIYGNVNCFLRIGPDKLIKRELDMHRSLLELNFPVAKIIDEGYINEEYYYVEESLGDKVLGKIFSYDFRTSSEISPENFSHFIDVINRYANSQVASFDTHLDVPDFISGIQIEELFKEAPELKKITEEATAKAIKRLSVFPAVFSQGDFNPHNIFPKGVIDFDMGFEAPFGYDLVTAIFHTYAFPLDGIAEYNRGYIFSKEQEKTYLKMVDDIAAGAGLPKVSDFAQDFMIGRLIWSVVRLEDCPLLQKWRYEKFRILIEKYLNDVDFMDVYKTY